MTSSEKTQQPKPEGDVTPLPVETSTERASTDKLPADTKPAQAVVPEEVPTTSSDSAPEPEKKKDTVAKPTHKKEPTKKKPASKPVKKTATKVPVNPKLKLTQIVLPKDWNREQLGDISDLLASMPAVGQVQAIVVAPTTDPKKFLLVDGRRRFAAAQELGYAHIEYTITTIKKDKPRAVKAFAANLARRDNTPSEIAQGFESLAVDHKMTNESIAKACGKTPGFVSQHRAVMKAPKKLQTALKKGEVVVSLFRYFTRITGEEDKTFNAKMVEQALKGVSAAKIGAKIEAYLRKKDGKSSGKKASPPKPRGAAAHKKKGPSLEIRDYTTDDVYKVVTLVKKQDAIDTMNSVSKKLKSATTKDRKTYYQGQLDGMEMLTGLSEER